jgi:hypothetical protein
MTEGGGAVPFLYYFGFVAVLVTGFVASAFLRGAETPTVAAVGRANSETAPLEKLQREIAIRRGVIPPEQEEHVEVKIAPMAVQTETAAVTPARPATSEIKEEAKADSPEAAAVQAKPAARVKQMARKETAKCGPGGCGAQQVRSVWSDADRLP